MRHESFQAGRPHGAPEGIVTAFKACRAFNGRLANADNKISYSGYRFPPDIIQQAVWLYLRFTLNLREVEDLLAERGVAVSYETVRRWVNHFGPMIAADLRKRRLRPHSTWHLNEAYLKIDGRMASISGARSTPKAKRSMCWSSPSETSTRPETDAQVPDYAFARERLVTDDLQPCGAAARDLGIERRHERGRWKNNRAEPLHEAARLSEGR